MSDTVIRYLKLILVNIVDTAVAASRRPVCHLLRTDTDLVISSPPIWLQVNCPFSQGEILVCLYIACTAPS
jgi:hypothetical protein